MVVAVDAVRTKSMSIRKASVEFKLSKTANAKRLRDGVVMVFGRLVVKLF